MTWRDPPFAELLDTGHDPTALARDWITIWHSEMAAASVDREAQETWRKLLAVWAETADAMLRAFAPPPRQAPPEHPFPGDERGDGWRRTGPAAAARTAPADAAPDAGAADVDQLARRIEELERRLAELERGPG
jgi:hypothetical protein